MIKYLNLKKENFEIYIKLLLKVINIYILFRAILVIEN